ncbi:negative regulator of systemic acquired resistance SNI1-like isoform X1 [Primulina eburnea]|uniref:negative regulator of systemic acquired resistance SNI1-like isoform X1 n=1 Tax=Primulina eburnea TaxID=1245227 RepID=UPI003C6CB55B
MEMRRIAGEGAYGGMEENTMAMLDNSGFSRSKFCHHIKDDRLAFLEAVRTASLLSDNGSAPTRKMFEAIFHILKDVDSLDLIMESYQLLIELHKHFPRVFLSKVQSESSSSSNNLFKLSVVQEAWLPFTFGLDPYNNEANKPSRGSVDSLGFHSLIQEVATVDKVRKSEVMELMYLKNMLLLQYLIIFLEGDFLPRNCAFKEELNWTFLRESLVNMLLGSRKILYKSLIKDCLSLMHVLSREAMSFEDLRYHESSSMESSQESKTAAALALPEAKKSTCAALNKFFLMVMELDSSRSSADMQGLTTRADGVRTPVVEIILDELIYDNDIRCSFLQVFDEPKWKLKIIIQYFQKYIPKSSVQTRRSNGPVNDETFDGILKYLANSNNTRSIIKKICTEVVQLLLAHAFQAYLALQLKCASDGSAVSPEDIQSMSSVKICNSLISAFMCLKREDRSLELNFIGKEVLFTAATILSTKSQGL